MSIVRLRAPGGLRQLRESVTGLIVLFALVLVIEAVGDTAWRLPNPTPLLLLAVVYAGLHDGRTVTFVTALLAVGYAFTYFDTPGHLFVYTREDQYRLLVMALVAPGMAWMTTTLKERALLLARESAARASAERERDLVRVVIDSSPLAILVTQGPEHRVAMLNPAALRLFGLDATRVVGAPVTQGFSGAPALRDLLDATLTHGKRQVSRGLELHLREDRDINLEIHAVPFSPPSSAEKGVLLMAFDVTEQDRSRLELEQARSELARGERLATMGAMLSGVAHEVRTPLAVISNQLHMLGARFARAEDAGELPSSLASAPTMIDEALAGVNRANGLVMELRRFVKMEPAQRRALSLDAPVREALRLFQLTHPGYGTVCAAYEPTVDVLADALHVQQIVLNLVENAVAVSPRERPVRVYVGAWECGAQIRVVDEGPGMPPEVLDRVFDPFFTTKEEGTGLGLAIVRRLAQTHEASVDVESEVGRGTTFRVRFPAAEVHVPVLVSSHSPRSVLTSR